MIVSEDLKGAGMGYADPDRPQPEDDIAGAFTMKVDEEPGAQVVPGVERVQAETADGSIALYPVPYPQYRGESDPDCTWSRRWEDVEFLDLSGMLEVATFTEDLETGVRDPTKGSVVLFRTEEQVDGRGYPFGYDYTEVNGHDDNCDAPWKGSESRYDGVLRLRDYAERTGDVPVVRDAEGRLFMEATITQDVTWLERNAPYTPMMGGDHGTRTITIDLMGLPPGVGPPP